MSLPATMKAVVFEGPYKVSVQERPVPRVQENQDVVVQVQATALCGSELHVYRGIETCGTGFVMGHEFTGVVVEVGSAVKTLRIGDKVVCPFTTSCGDCFYCSRGHTSRCVHSLLLGSEALDGAQADYVRVPFADGTVMKAPNTIGDKVLILMADIFPTGFYGVKSAIDMSLGVKVEESTMVVVGCGPVGLCAIIAALHFRPRHIFAIDSVQSRLDIARSLGAEPLNFKDGADKMKSRVLEVTDGRGADMVVEVVGMAPALRTAFDLLRPFGAISSIGVHNAEIPWSGSEGYDKNVRLQMGRCPVRQIFAEALEVMEKQQHLFQFMFDHEMPLSEAVEGYTLFEQMKVQKVVFKP
ncbi:chaperonin 10-like protein [Stachybotrys elegans]|uniref:Chaperonin 10-like protein n=1 Tax=Stachybotrys elegans TaxID=80388 RepID=A0A8K0SN62_9HYPO|nr:chaperonin 10-like protein [Stachybotrys elegans]